VRAYKQANIHTCKRGDEQQNEIRGMQQIVGCFCNGAREESKTRMHRSALNHPQQRDE